MSVYKAFCWFLVFLLWFSLLSINSIWECPRLLLLGSLVRNQNILVGGFAHDIPPLQGSSHHVVVLDPSFASTSQMLRIGQVHWEIMVRCRQHGQTTDLA